MVKALFDTSILIDYLNAVPQARDEMARYADRAISMITWIDVMVGAPAEKDVATRNFLSGFTTLPLDAPALERAVTLRRMHRLKLPDAIIWATAQSSDRLLVTRNAKSFPTDAPDIRMPYRV